MAEAHRTLTPTHNGPPAIVAGGPSYVCALLFPEEPCS